MRFSIRNIAIWTTSCGLVFAFAQLVGLGFAVAVTAFVAFTFYLYEDGLRSAGLSANRFGEFVSDVPSSNAKQGDSSAENSTAAGVVTTNAPIAEATPSALATEAFRRASIDPPRTPATRRRLGPGPYLLIPTVFAVFFVAPIAVVYPAMVLVVPIVVALAGGGAYRWVSRDWPIDSTVRQRQCAWIVVVVILTVIVPVAQTSNLDTAIVGGIWSVGFTCAILISGLRRAIR